MSTKSEAATRINTMTKFRCGLDLVRYSIGDGRELVYVPQAGLSQILSAQEVQLLQYLPGFATLEEHAIQACRQLGFAQTPVMQVRDQLVNLAERQLLVSETALRNVLLSNTGTAESRQITTLGIPTNDNSKALERCLTSYKDCARLLERAIRFVVADDSDGQSSAQNLALMERVCKERESEIFYCNRQDKENYASALARQSQLPLDVVRFAVLGDQYPVNSGASRNALLLSTANELTVQVDDDTVCGAEPMPGRIDGLALTSDYTATSFWCAGETDTNDNDNQIDFFAAHETLLGKSFGALARLYAQDLNLDTINHSFLKQLQPDKSVVAVTSLAVAGDCCLSVPELLLRLDGDNRTRLVASEQVFSAALRDENLLQGVRQLLVSNASFPTGFTLGLDNAQILPPFVPVRDNQDKCYANLLQCNPPACYFGFAPWAVAHRPQLRRQTSRQEPSGSLSAGDIIFAWLRSFEMIAGADAALNFHRLGQYLMDWGSAPLQDFEQEIKRIVWIQASAKIDRFEWLLQKHAGQPEFWALAIRTQCDSLKAALDQGNYIVPPDFAQLFGPEQARTMMQKFVFQLGQLLISWTQLRRAAEELRDSGFVFGRRI